MKLKRFIGKAAIVAASMLFAMLLGENKIYGADEAKVYQCGENGTVNDKWELKVDAEAGHNYEVTVTFTGIDEKGSVISLGYDSVTNDQMVKNVQTSQDRSGLIDESVTAGKVETRTFSVAAVEDYIIVKASGTGKIISVSVSEIESKEAHKRTIFTIGDSLVQTYSDDYAPQTGWGQVLQEYFNDEKIVVENHALGGRSTGSYLREGRLNEVLLNVQQGDYVLIEFGHNDASKQKEDRYVSVEDYKILLKEQYIRAIEQRGGIPVLVTLVNRNDYNKNTGVFNVSFERYVTAMKQVAEENGTKIIDLNKKTVEYFTKLNDRFGIGITEAVIYNYAKPGEYTGAYAEGVSDNTHLQKYGARLVAGMVAEGMCEFGIDELSESYIKPASSDSEPEVPTDLKMKDDSWISGSIEWKPAEGADFYKVYVADVTDGEEAEYKEAGYTSTCRFTYEDIVIYRTYKFKVVAMNGNGESDESEELLFEAKNPVNNKNDDVVTRIEEEKAGNGDIIVFIITGAVIGAGVIGIIVYRMFNRKTKNKHI